MSLLTNTKRFPEKGDELKFTGANKMFYPHFTDMVERGRKNLKLGEIYIVSKVEVYSSWCAVWLEGFPQEDRDYYNLGMFEYPVKNCIEVLESVTQDVRVLSKISELRNAADNLELLLQNSKELLNNYKDLLKENQVLKEKIQKQE